MSAKEDFSRMDDPTFLAERKKVREEIEELQEQPEAHNVEYIEALKRRYAQFNDEFDRRARGAWSKKPVRTS